MRRSLLAALLGATLAALAGCDSPLAPSRLAGTYVLAAVGEAPPPVVVIDDALMTITVLADTLRLQSNGSGEQVVVQHYRYHDTSTRPADTEILEVPVYYQIRGDRIEFTFGCPRGKYCLAILANTFTGRLTADGLVIDTVPAPRAYRRIGR
jgi:hypothetical protein